MVTMDYLYSNAVKQTKMNGSILLDQIDLFKEFPDEQRRWLAGFFTRYQSSAGSRVFAQNSPANYIYILTAGEVLVRYKPYDGEELTISRIQPGGVFGWSAALGNPHYTAGALSAGECQMLRMRGADLRRVCQENPQVGSQLLEILANAAGQRFSSAHTQVFALLEYGVTNSADSAEER
jgi:CRP/FNR family cyclic AMP-dependent transcriptional regulator